MNFIIDAKAGGVPNAVKDSINKGKFKMHPDEALKIFHMEKGTLNKKVLDEVCKTIYVLLFEIFIIITNIMWLILFLLILIEV